MFAVINQNQKYWIKKMLFQRNVDMFGLGTIFLHNGEKEIIKLIQSVREFFFSLTTINQKKD